MYLVVLCVGLIVGSFINVLIIRHGTGVGIGGRSRCMHCRTTLGVFDLVPVFSYLFLRGRCRYCATPISSRYAFIELAAALYALVIFLTVPTLPLMTLYWLAGIPLLVIAGYDVAHLIIPLFYARILTLLGVVATAYSLTASGSLLFLQPQSIVAAGVLMLFFYSLWFFSDGAWMGFGDVGLVGSLGLLFGYPISLIGTVFAFWLGALFGIYLLWQTKSRRTLKSEVPFGPFLIAGFVLAQMVSVFYPTILLII